jgi:hypothetical protein
MTEEEPAQRTQDARNDIARGFFERIFQLHLGRDAVNNLQQGIGCSHSREILRMKVSSTGFTCRWSIVARFISLPIYGQHATS